MRRRVDLHPGIIRSMQESSDTPKSPHSAGTGPLLQDRDIRLIFGTRIISEIGSRITREGLPVVAVLNVAATPVQMGLMAALPGLPAVILGPLAGLWLDRTRRRPAMLVMDLLRAALLLTIPLAWAVGRLGFIQILLVTALVSGCSTIFQIADQAYLPFLVGRTRLEEGNALMSTADGVGETAGPVLMGALVQWLGAPLAILLDALSYLSSALGLGMVKRQERVPETGSLPHFRRDVMVGFGLLSRHRLLGTLLLVAAVESVFGGFFSTLYELYVLRVLHLSALDLGILVTTGGIGALIAAQFASRLMRRLHLHVLLPLAFLIGTLANFLIPLAHGPWYMAFLFLMGAQVIGDGAGTLYQIAVSVIQQRMVDDLRLGRLGGAVRLIPQSLGMVGALIAGGVAMAIGIRATFWIMPVGTCLALPLFWRRDIRALGRPEDLVPAS